MRVQPRRLVFAVTLSVTLLVAAVSVALAQERPKQGPRAALLEVAADYVGLDRRGLVAELRKGQSLAQVAAARGKSSEGLEQALLAAARERLDRRNLSDERKRAILSRLGERIDRLVKKVWADAGNRARRAKGGLLKAAAEYLGLSREQLREQLRTGQSLAQIAAAQDKSVAGLERALLDAVRERLDRAGAGLSAERRERILARAQAKIERLINRRRGQR
jgi:hypothetical protein